NPLILTAILGWLFSVVLWSSLAVVRHAESLAWRLGEPYGTLLLTLTITSIEVVAISAVVRHGGPNPTLMRETLLALIMIIMNGMGGVTLLIGGGDAGGLQGGRRLSCRAIRAADRLPARNFASAGAARGHPYRAPGRGARIDRRGEGGARQSDAARCQYLPRLCAGHDRPDDPLRTRHQPPPRAPGRPRRGAHRLCSPHPHAGAQHDHLYERPDQHAARRRPPAAVPGLYFVDL